MKNGQVVRAGRVEDMTKDEVLGMNWTPFVGPRVVEIKV